MRHTLLLFDIDLTLVNARGAGQIAMRTAGEQVCGKGFSFEGVSFGGRLDPLIYADATARCTDIDAASLHGRFRDLYTRELRRLIHEHGHTVETLPGIYDLITGLHARVSDKDDIILGLLTGNYAETAKIKIEAAGLQREWFTLGCFGDEAPSRPGLAELALRRYEQTTKAKPDPARVIVIGDTPHDVGCAKAHGCTAFAVATGRTPAHELSAAGADFVVNDLSDPEPLLSLLD
ncbi:MAG: haloacid dehalogenase-like hydrolase [Phycisphaerales bacterium]